MADRQDENRDELGTAITRTLDRMGSAIHAGDQASFRHALEQQLYRIDPPRARRQHRALLAALVVAMTVSVIAAVTIFRGDERRSTIRPSTISTTDETVPVDQATTAEPSPPASATADEVRLLPAAPIAGRTSPLAVWTGSEMIVFGGIELTNGGTAMNDGAAFQPSTGTWRTIAPPPVDFGGYGVAIWTGTEMFVAGGRPDGEQPASVALYDPVADTWRAPSLGTLRAEQTSIATWTGSEVIITGGVNIDVSGAAYDPVADTWRTIATGPGHLEPMGARLVWTGELAVTVLQPEGDYLSIGVSPTVPDVSPADTTPPSPDTTPPSVTAAADLPDENQQRIAAYDPVEDTWTVLDYYPYLTWPVATPESTAGAITLYSWFDQAALGTDGSDLRFIESEPLGERTDFQSRPVWTGREILLWEGGDVAQAFNPSTGLWRLIPAGGLHRRIGAAAVWTGTQLLTWGGGNYGAAASDFDDGIIFTPASS